MAQVHYDIHIFGRVQGVFFRQNCETKAKELHLTGFVRNEPDGSVTVSAEGREQNIQNFVTWCKSGPPLAKVEQVKISPGHLQNYSTFEIIS